MALRYNGTIIGKIVIKQKDNKFNLQIRQGNCLAVIINVRKTTEEELKKHPNSKLVHTLYTFFTDEHHLKNLLKNEGGVIFDEVISIELNMFYKENYTLLKYFVKSGYKVKCYYKEKK